MRNFICGHDSIFTCVGQTIQAAVITIIVIVVIRLFWITRRRK